MHRLWPFGRSQAQPQALTHSWEHAGISVAGEPIPWCADAIVVEALVRVPAGLERNRSDFTLRIPGRAPVVADQLRRFDSGESHRAIFRTTPPGGAVVAELVHRDRALGQVTLPYLSREDFLASLELESPTLFVRMGKETVACQTFVASQCRGVIAGGLLHSPTSLLPLRELGLEVEFRCERTNDSFRMPASLTSTQITGRTTLVNVVPGRHPRRLGTWTATWLVGEHPLATLRVRGISTKVFQRSLRVCETRFVVQSPGGGCRLQPQAPAPDSGTRAGPCFLVASREPGMAGLCKLQVTAQVPGSAPSPVMGEMELLLSDGPTVVAPGTVDAADLGQVSGFELRSGSRVLGNLSMSPAPRAQFTSEGCFESPGEYHWTAALEEEMTDRLNRLIGRSS